MARLKIPDPQPIIFSRQWAVTGDYINGANHIGNESFVSLFNATTEQYFLCRGAPPYTVYDQILINTEFSVQLKSEARRDDCLGIHLGVENFHRCGCDFIYRINNSISGVLVARAQFSFLCFDYQAGCLADAGERFQDFFIRSECDEQA